MTEWPRSHALGTDVHCRVLTGSTRRKSGGWETRKLRKYKYTSWARKASIFGNYRGSLTPGLHHRPGRERDEDENKARQVDYLLMRLKQQQLVLPEGADIVSLVEQEGKPANIGPTLADVPRQAVTLGHVKDRYLATHFNGTIEVNSLDNCKPANWPSCWPRSRPRRRIRGFTRWSRTWASPATQYWSGRNSGAVGSGLPAGCR